MHVKGVFLSIARDIGKSEPFAPGFCQILNGANREGHLVIRLMGGRKMVARKTLKSYEQPPIPLGEFGISYLRLGDR